MKIKNILISSFLLLHTCMHSQSLELKINKEGIISLANPESLASAEYEYGLKKLNELLDNYPNAIWFFKQLAKINEPVFNFNDFSKDRDYMTITLLMDNKSEHHYHINVYHTKPAKITLAFGVLKRIEDDYNFKEKIKNEFRYELLEHRIKHLEVTLWQTTGAFIYGFAFSFVLGFVLSAKN